MKIFVSNRTKDSNEANKLIRSLLKHSDYSIAVLREETHSDKWKESVESKIREVDFVLILLGKETFKSDPMKWEYAKAKELNKRIIAIKLPNADKNSVVFCQGYQVFENEKQCYKYLEKTFSDVRELKIEQYKIMVSSTELVTTQRMKVNNLFFTVTSSILSVSFFVGNYFGFSITGNVAMLVLIALAFTVSFFWEKLINSYGTLNTGKFKVIDKIEKQLRTNMFEDEWEILTNEINYQPHTKTETTIIGRFRWFIGILWLAVLVYAFFPFIKDLFQC